MLVFFLFWGKWLFAMKLVFLHFEFVFCVYFPCFYHLSHCLWTLSRLLGRLSRPLGLSPLHYFPMWYGRAVPLLVPLVLPFCFFSLVLGVEIRLIPLFLSWNAKIFLFVWKKSSKSLAVAHKVATFASAFGREPFAIVLWEFYMRQER